MLTTECLGAPCWSRLQVDPAVCCKFYNYTIVVLLQYVSMCVCVCVCVILPPVNIHLNTAADGISTSKCSRTASAYDTRMAETAERTCKLMHDNKTNKVHNRSKSQLRFISLQCFSAYVVIFRHNTWDIKVRYPDLQVPRSTDVYIYIYIYTYIHWCQLTLTKQAEIKNLGCATPDLVISHLSACSTLTHKPWYVCQHKRLSGCAKRNALLGLPFNHTIILAPALP